MIVLSCFVSKQNGSRVYFSRLYFEPQTSPNYEYLEICLKFLKVEHSSSIHYSFVSLLFLKIQYCQNFFSSN